MIGDVGLFFDAESHDDIFEDDTDEFPCDKCGSHDCESCERVSLEMMLAHMFRGELSDVISVGEFGDDENDI